MRRHREPSHAEMLAQATDRLHIMQALDSALERWPEVSALAWEAESTEEFITQLGELLGIDETQATAVADLQLRRIPREQRAWIRAQVDEIKVELAHLRSTDPT
ncbi:DNA gyrase subunit A [Aeromicrobium duanguangcaii]|uniref:DNA topoisomerase (ATP-hydrolyzing) n=1 Tax=Aeromicrobium duanguangcaii TaxID=2968086 RepID=A0ABY5KHL4_9ACTN|nr:DNA gyrase subunit A [Aeromicrobium duanguangcaii]MCD9152945.1 hypothetical protein [Aeromicrobium duanguangcaii]UUI69949.1 hypothetical protein NP095_07600 [Aeromicrobium duanguangcaii]